MAQSILNMPTPLHRHLSFFNLKAANARPHCGASRYIQKTHHVNKNWTKCPSIKAKITYTSPCKKLKIVTVKPWKEWTPEKFQECWLCTGQTQLSSGICKQNLKPQTNYHCCLCVRYLVPYCLILITQ